METGLAKEVLRKWEERYGFPNPVRDGAGDRVYTNEQVYRLKLIKKLLDDGRRPGEIVGLEPVALVELTRTLQPEPVHGGKLEPATELLGWLQTRDPGLLHARLRAEVIGAGLSNFIFNVLPGMTKLVGDAWASGDIAVRDEHLFTEIVQGLVREALSQTVIVSGTPRILLTTMPGERHTLGILMAEAALTLHGACCISLGAQSPLSEIVLAAQDYQVQIVGLSFSTSFAKRKIIPLLRALRKNLPAHIELWGSGAGVLRLEKTPRGVVLIDSLTAAVKLIHKCRSHQQPDAE